MGGDSITDTHIEKAESRKNKTSYCAESEEIGFLDLLGVIRRRISVIILCLSISVILAGVYLAIAEPVFRSEARLFPPQNRDLEGFWISLGRVDEEQTDRYSSDQVFERMLRNLGSQGLRREFFEDHDLAKFYLPEAPTNLATVEQTFDKRFNESFQIDRDPLDPSVAVISFSYVKPDLAAKWLNQFIEFVDTHTIQQLGSDVGVEIDAEIKSVRNKMSRMLVSAQRNTQDRIIRLKESLRIAKTLGITDTSTLSVLSGGVNQGGVAVNTAQLPQYMRGINALEEEIMVLQARKSEEPFIEGYRALQARLEMLESISLALGDMSAVYVDIPAREAYSPEKPRKLLLLLLAVVLGTTIGVLFVSAAEVWSKRQVSR